MLDELHALRADLAHHRRLPLPPPFDDGFLLSFGIPSQKGEVHLNTCRGFLLLEGDFFCMLELVEFRLYLGASLCMYPFWLLIYFFGLFMLRGDTLLYYVSCFTIH